MKRMKRKKKAGNDDGSQDDEAADDPGQTSIRRIFFPVCLLSPPQVKFSVKVFFN